VSVAKPKTLIEIYAELLEPYNIATSPLQEVLREAALRAGWYLPSAKAVLRQRAAASGRKTQVEQDLAHRRILVSFFFKKLKPIYRAKPGSERTAQAIIGRIDELPWDKVRKPPMTVRTIQADIKFMRENGILANQRRYR
jgi:hypothetical protein